MRHTQRAAVVIALAPALALAAVGVPARAATTASGVPVADPAGLRAEVVAAQPIGSNRLVTARSGGSQSPSGGAGYALSEDGSVALIGSADPNFMPGQTTSGYQLYLRDLTTGATQLVSHAADGTPGNGDSSDGDISADGTRVTYVSEATNLVPADSDDGSDVYLFDSVLNASRLVSRTPSGQRGNGASDSPRISADGTRIAYTSTASNLDPGGAVWPRTDNIYAYDVVANRSRLITRSYSGGAVDANSGGPDISGDGRRVVFWSYASNLVRGGDAGAQGDVYLYDQNTGAIELASRTVGGKFFFGHKYYPPSISADGTKIAYVSTASSLASDPVVPLVENVYLYDTASHVTRLVTRGYDGAAARGEIGSYLPVLSADGRGVSFQSDATNLVAGDSNQDTDVFASDVSTGTTRLVSKATTGLSGNKSSYESSISPDGRFVIYSSRAENLVARDTNGVQDGFVFRVS